MENDDESQIFDDEECENLRPRFLQLPSEDKVELLLKELKKQKKIINTYSLRQSQDTSLGISSRNIEPIESGDDGSAYGVNYRSH